MNRGLLLYSDQALLHEHVPDKPLGIVVLSSLRDLKLVECNGHEVILGRNGYYVEGSIERIVRETMPGGHLHGLISLKGVIIDDTRRDVEPFPDLPLYPKKGKPWLHPYNLENDEGVLLRDVTTNIQSVFRKLPAYDYSGRRVKKFTFEKSVSEKAKDLGADIILSDSYMAKLEFLFGQLGFLGRVLNIHPGPSILDKNFCFRGKEPYIDAIRFAQEYHSDTFTGATLHFVDHEVDAGLPIAYNCNTPVYGLDTVRDLMLRNYPTKMSVLIAGLKHYVLRVYPYLKESHQMAKNWNELVMNY